MAEHENEDEIVFVSMPYNPGAYTVPGTTLRIADCGHQIMVAPSGRKIIDQHPGIKIMCLGCAPNDLAQQDVRPFTKEQLDEAAEAFAHIRNMN